MATLQKKAYFQSKILRSSKPLSYIYIDIVRSKNLEHLRTQNISFVFDAHLSTMNLNLSFMQRKQMLAILETIANIHYIVFMCKCIKLSCVCFRNFQKDTFPVHMQ